MDKTTLHRRQTRSAVTILEVLFAIGIVMVGLVGIASIIPLAGRQAADSYIITQSSSLGQSAFREILARQNHFPSTAQPWVFLNDQIASPVYVTDNDLSNATLSVCIDPMFWAAQPNTPLRNGQEGGYRRAVFPYYSDSQNPLASPMAANAWGAAQPRMLRVSLANAAGRPMTMKVAERRFSLLDDFTNPIDETDGNKEGIRGFFTDTDTPFSPTNLVQAATKQEMTWMATLVPQERGENRYHLLSIIVFNKRDRTFAAPTIGGGAPVLDDLPKAERIAWGTGIGSTSGGNGFSMKITAAAVYASGELVVDTSLKSGDWVMLSRNNGTLPAVHRWYRVISTTDAEFSNSVTDPFGNASGPVWQRDIQVIGPDWIFSNAEPTTVTLVDNVASVYERVVAIERPNM